MQEQTSIRVKEIQSLLKEGYDARVNNISHAVNLTTQALALSNDLKDGALIAAAKSQLGLFCMIQGEFQNAITYSEESLVYFKKVNDQKGIADAQYNIAGVHYKTDDYYLGLHYLLDCLSIYRTLGDLYSQARVLKSMGTIYEYLGDLDNAVESYLKCVEMGRATKDPNLESNAYNPLSGVYLKRNQHDLAIDIIEKSIAIKQQTNDIRGLAFALYGRGKVYIKLRKFDLALSDLTQSLSIHQQVKDKLGVAMAYNKLGSLYFERKDYDRAEKFLLDALQISEEFNIRFIRFKAYYSLHQVARAQGKTQEALDYLEKYIHIKESIINSHTYTVIKSYEAISRVDILEREAKAQKDKTEIIEKKNAELDSFFYRVSHDLKGPIASLLGLNNLIKLEVKDEHAQRYFNMYQTQLMRINNIVMDLIDLTRMNNQEENKVRIDFETLLDECIQSYHYVDNFKSIRFIKKIDKDIEFYSVWAIVNTILQNLVENAIKYASPAKDSFVMVSIQTMGDNIRIDVEDNGVGIQADYQSRVFNMFFRANDHVQGTGLGLYILKRAVERLDGEVRFESDVNSGTKFTVVLPCSAH